MPQVEGGPKGLNALLHSTYSSALSSGHTKETASAIAWSAAKNKYKKHGEKWVSKIYRDLRDVALITQSEILKSPNAHESASKMEHLVFALAKLSEFMTNPDSAIEDSPIKKSAIEHLSTNDVDENPLNREIDRSKVDGIKQHIEDTGSIKPLVYVEIDKDGKKAKMITDGHHRLVALKELGYSKFPARVSDDRGTDTTKDDQPIKLQKEISSVAVEGLALVRQDLQGRRAMRTTDTLLENATRVEKGGPGSGSWEGPNDPRYAWSQRSSTKGAIKSANAYLSGAGLAPIGETEPVKVDPTKATRIAQAYEAMASNPNDPAVQRAYGALGSEVSEQYKALPIKIEFTKDDPYKTSEEMFNDVEQNGKLKVFTGGEKHPLLGAPDENGISANDKFRAVHDYYGHVMFGHKFGPSGEENAWVEHSKMFSPEAQKALTTETRGQNSWFNFSSENQGKAPHDRKFAEQKVGILPDEFLPESNTSTRKFVKGGQGSGSWEGPGQPRFPHAGNKDFAEPFHSGNHVKQFLSSNNVIIASVDKGDLSPEKNELRQHEFEEKLKDKKIPYKKGSGASSEWGNETSYIIQTPSKEEAEKLHHELKTKYKQESVIHVRNGHATLQHSDGSVQHANVDKLEAGVHLTDNYTNVDGQKFAIRFK